MYAEEWASTHSFHFGATVIATGENAATIRRIWDLLEPALAREDIELVEVEIGSGGSKLLLRIYLDKGDGIDLDTCAEAARLIGTLLEGEEVISSAYNLEVGSPGIDRAISRGFRVSL